MSSTLKKIERLSQGAVFDLTCSEERPDPAQVNALKSDNSWGLSSAASDHIPGVSNVNNCGRAMPVLRILQTSHCKFNCKYCSFRKDYDRKRESLESCEIARIAHEMSQGGIIEGFFLSSGIGDNAISTMTKIVDTARILREKYLFTDYLHLKILPGTPIDLIEAAGQYADRLSVNMEAPTESTLHSIAPNKSIKHNILKQMQWIETLRREGKISRRVGQTTQFVVGSSDDPGANDRALITAVDYFYDQLNMRRVYYSAFEPIPGTPLQDRPAENPKRSFRLYQADRLVALYGFKAGDFVFNDNGRLDLETDPKEVWARAHPELFPMDISRVEPSDLLRIPGIGPITAKKILRARFEGSLKTVDDFRKITRVSKKTFEFILVGGKPGLPGQLKTPASKPDQLILPYA